MTDRELLEYAAKACGIELHGWADGKAYIRAPYCIGEEEWNPIASSADCAAMCAKLNINTFFYLSLPKVECSAEDAGDEQIIRYTASHNGTDKIKKAAWRYAATRVAAMIGGMK